MNYSKNWPQEWHIEKGDHDISNKLVPVFECFLDGIVKKKLSKKTFRRHEAACFALGDYIIENIFGYKADTFPEDESGENIILHYITENEGPLVHYDNESWQNELDATCRKLFKHIKMTIGGKYEK